MLGYGSTLRNVGKFDKAIAILRSGARTYPRDKSFLVFLALTLHSAGKKTEALRIALKVISDLDKHDLTIRRYRRSLAHYRRTLNSQ